MQNDDLKRVFFAECFEFLSAMEEKLLSLGDHPNSEDLNAIFRCVHSIKGGAGTFGFDDVTRFAHAMENLLGKLRNGSLPVTRAAVDTLLQAQDILHKMLTTAHEGGSVKSGMGATVLQQLEALAAGRAAGEAPMPTAAAKKDSFTSIRVDINKLDHLVNMVGEMAITQSMMQAQLKTLPPAEHPLLMQGADSMREHTRELQEAVMSVRMQPLSTLFARMPRIVHDLSQQLGKDIRLIVSGEETEVDKTIIERLADPLTHMIRNAVDHGIEGLEVRATRGKPAQGTIHLSAGHRGGRICIEVGDDGGGIHRKRVLAAAREQGLVADDAAPTDAEIDSLIFLPGLSTTGKVTDVSGRGVGMDVVRRNIEAIGGSVSIENSEDGARFCILLPLTLALLDGMIVRAGAERYILPVCAIRESMRPQESDLRTVPGAGEVVRLRGEFVPLFYLHRLLSIPGAGARASQGLVILVESAGARYGLVVDELLGQQQVVIKSLEANYEAVNGISSATILGDGRVCLILDPAGLRHCRQPLSRAA